MPEPQEARSGAIRCPQCGRVACGCTAPPGVTIHAAFDHIYYDGLLTFAQGCYTGQGPVVWMGEPLPKVEASRV